MKKNNIDQVLALRGDRPRDMTDEQYESRDFRYASEMTEWLKKNTDFDIAGACYPEKHFEALDTDTDLRNLRKKSMQEHHSLSHSFSLITNYSTDF